MDNCWDGLFLSKLAETGVYVYIIDISYRICGQLKLGRKYGDVTVID
jgi:hypothetical protein